MAMMNQYGNSLPNPYGQQDYSNFFGSKNNYGAQGLNSNLVWVQGLEGAKALMLNPNAKIIMLDSEIENRAYIKMADELGATKLKKFELTEIIEDESSNKLSDYVRKDELQALLSEIFTSQKGVETHEQTVSTTQPVIKRTVLSNPANE